MQKPKPFIHWEDHGYYELGMINIGRVGIPLFVLLIGTVVVAGLFAVAGIFYHPLLWVSLGIVALLILAGLLFLLGLFIWWVWDSIEINGPEGS